MPLPQTGSVGCGSGLPPAASGIPAVPLGSGGFEEPPVPPWSCGALPAVDDEPAFGVGSAVVPPPTFVMSALLAAVPLSSELEPAVGALPLLPPPGADTAEPSAPNRSLSGRLQATANSSATVPQRT